MPPRSALTEGSNLSFRIEDAAVVAKYNFFDARGRRSHCEVREMGRVGHLFPKSADAARKLTSTARAITRAVAPAARHAPAGC